MRIGFYPKLAMDGIRKNKRMYFPYILTCIGMVMMHYIIVFLQESETVSYMAGSGTVKGMLQIGGNIIAVFAGFFLFYTNSFLLRRRKKEFGLYNMLGMGKRHIALILFWETLLVYLFSVIAGLAGGIAFSKLAELGLVKIMRGEATYSFALSAKAIVTAAKVYGVISILLFFNALRQIKFSTALSLLRSENVGEKAPKANWFLGIAGIVILGAAYVIAVKIQDPISAMLLFFCAVLLVIVGTYLLLISGSVMLCRILQKNKKYYYRANHFVSVSSMAYRMKRNGAGLASVCILATMVLVMISSTASLYFGTEDVLDRRYPEEMNLDVRLEVEEAGEAEDRIGLLREKVNEFAKSRGAERQNVKDYRIMTVGGMLMEDGTVETDQRRAGNLLSMDTYNKIYQFDFMSLEDYNRLTGGSETLGEGECLLSGYEKQFTEGVLAFRGGREFRIKGTAPFDRGITAVQVITVVVSDFPTVVETAGKLLERCEQPAVLNWEYHFDTGLRREEQIALRQELQQMLQEEKTDEQFGIYSSYAASRAQEGDYQYAISAAFLYLGVVLSIVFIFAAVLIIYYKQISEGYEDQARFRIMQKVGMTKREIRKSINSQLLTVFFVPLLLAGAHLAFAFPIIQKLLLLFSLDNFSLFASTTAGCFAVFALCYGLVYRATSNAYYGIVTGARGDEE